MSRRANPTVIGGFVLGAIGVVVVGVAVFGGGKFFVHRPRAVTFFQGNIQGLTIGSSVTLRGVQVGSVSDIQLRLNVKTMEPVIPVYIEFDTDRFKARGNAASTEELLEQQPLKTAIANGLHARLASQSLVTGQLLVELDLDPGEPSRLVGADPSTVEIPTSQSDIEKLKKTLTELPLTEIAASAHKLLVDADRVLTSEDIPKLLQSLVGLADRFQTLATDARGELHSTGEASRETLVTAQKALAEMRTTLTTANQLLTTDTREAIKAATAALQNAQKTLADANSLVAPNSPQRYDIDQALRNLAATTRSLRVLADELQRRPNAVVMGK
jgi:paraquat-inducible protein B